MDTWEFQALKILFKRSSLQEIIDISRRLGHLDFLGGKKVTGCPKRM